MPVGDDRQMPLCDVARATQSRGSSHALRRLELTPCHDHDLRRSRPLLLTTTRRVLEWPVDYREPRHRLSRWPSAIAAGCCSKKQQPLEVTPSVASGSPQFLGTAYDDSSPTEVKFDLFRMRARHPRSASYPPCRDSSRDGKTQQSTQDHLFAIRRTRYPENESSP